VHGVALDGENLRMNLFAMADDSIENCQRRDLEPLIQHAGARRAHRRFSFLPLQ